jgi:hypothetical protein
MSKEQLHYEKRDQYFAYDSMVDICLNELYSKLSELNLREEDYTYIEPSAGDGAFLKKLPIDRRIGVDIEPRYEGIIESDFLEWEPENGNYITVGGPPFGYRGDLAVKFINHASKFSDIVAFILPQYFEDEKDIFYCGDKVRDLKLVHSKKIDSEFRFPNGQNIIVGLNMYFQIWIKSLSS